MEEVLFSQAFSKNLNQSDFHVLQHYWKKKIYKAGDSILTQGQPSGGLYLIEKGEVKVTSCFPGSQEFTFGTLAAGEFFGEVSLMDGGPCTASVVATSATHCLFLDSLILSSLRIILPEVAHKLTRALGLYSIKRLRKIFASLPGLTKKVKPQYRNAFEHKKYSTVSESTLLRKACRKNLPKEKALLALDTFAEFSLAELRELRPYMSIVEVKENKKLFSESDLATCVYFIVEGSAQLAYEIEEIEIKLDVLGPGAFIGALPYFDGQTQGLSCVVREYAQLIIFKYEELNTIQQKKLLLYYKIYYELATSVIALLRSIDKQLLRIKCELKLSPI